MSLTALPNIDERPNGSLFTDFSDQHRYTMHQYMNPNQGAGLNKGCASMSLCKPSCGPQFFCENSVCPRGYVHASEGMCFPNNGVGKLKKAASLHK